LRTHPEPRRNQPGHGRRWSTKHHHFPVLKAPRRSAELQSRACSKLTKCHQRASHHAKQASTAANDATNDLLSQRPVIRGPMSGRLVYLRTSRDRDSVHADAPAGEKESPSPGPTARDIPSIFHIFLLESGTLARLAFFFCAIDTWA